MLTIRALNKAGRTITLDEPYGILQTSNGFVMRRMGFDVSETGYFLYVDGDRFKIEIF